MNPEEIKQKYDEVKKTVETINTKYGSRQINRDKLGRFAPQGSKSNGANYGARRHASIPVTRYRRNTSGKKVYFAQS